MKRVFNPSQGEVQSAEQYYCPCALAYSHDAVILTFVENSQPHLSLTCCDFFALVCIGSVSERLYHMSIWKVLLV